MVCMCIKRIPPPDQPFPALTTIIGGSALPIHMFGSGGAVTSVFRLDMMVPRAVTGADAAVLHASDRSLGHIVLYVPFY